MKEINKSGWQLVNIFRDSVYTMRLKVDGGHLHRVTVVDENNDRLHMNMCFVPDVDLQRYQSHLRDAYNQGFSDGKCERDHKKIGE